MDFGRVSWRQDAERMGRNKEMGPGRLKLWYLPKLQPAREPQPSIQK